VIKSLKIECELIIGSLDVLRKYIELEFLDS
jgi:hypothetical protein